MTTNFVFGRSVGVLLPAPQNLQVIQTIQLEDLELNFTQPTEWAPMAATRNTQAGFSLPFAFPIDVIALDTSIGVQYQGNDVAVLPVGHRDVTTDVPTREITLAFDGVPFSVYPNQHDNFQTFLQQTTTTASQAFNLIGSANTTTSIAIGQIVIQNIAFNVETSIGGLQGLKTRPTNVTQVDVAHGYSDYLLITAQSGKSYIR